MKHSEVAIGRNDPCWCNSGKKYKKCHLLMAKTTGLKPRARPPLIKSAQQIEGIRNAGHLAYNTLEMLEGRIVAGITTEDINTWVHEFTLEHGAIPAPLGYRGFPKSVCTSPNHVVCHGIPGTYRLSEGDIINVDVTPILNGYYGDSSRMYTVGHVKKSAAQLCQVAKECLDLGIAEVHPKNTLGDIGYAIQTHAEGLGYSVVRDFVGHGTGVDFHEDPHVPHVGKKGQGQPMLPGMVFTIEPMINLGGWGVRMLDDGWTAVTQDGSLSAQWEHTLLVTKDGVEILTLP